MVDVKFLIERFCLIHQIRQKHGGPLQKQTMAFLYRWTTKVCCYLKRRGPFKSSFTEASADLALVKAIYMHATRDVADFLLYPVRVIQGESQRLFGLSFLAEHWDRAWVESSYSIVDLCGAIVSQSLQLSSPERWLGFSVVAVARLLEAYPDMCKQIECVLIALESCPVMCRCPNRTTRFRNTLFPHHQHAPNSRSSRVRISRAYYLDKMTTPNCMPRTMTS